MNPRAITLLLFAILAFSVPCVSQELNRLDVAMRPFEAVGQADPEFVESLSLQLMRAIERNSEFRISPGGPTIYYLKGQVFTDGKRHSLTLQLIKARTDRTLWLENYDYRGVDVDMIATDVITALLSASPSDVWK